MKSNIIKFGTVYVMIQLFGLSTVVYAQSYSGQMAGRGEGAERGESREKARRNGRRRERMRWINDGGRRERWKREES